MAPETLPSSSRRFGVGHGRTPFDRCSADIVSSSVGDQDVRTEVCRQPRKSHEVCPHPKQSKARKRTNSPSSPHVYFKRNIGPGTSFSDGLRGESILPENGRTEAKGHPRNGWSWTLRVGKGGPCCRTTLVDTRHGFSVDLAVPLPGTHSAMPSFRDVPRNQPIWEENPRC